MQRRFLMKPPFKAITKLSGNLHQAKKLWMQRNQMNVMSKKSFKLAPLDFINIKIMPCVEGDKSDCQPKASSIAQS